MLPKIIVTDIDGVWTDGGMYYDELGNELKKFHTYDSAGILWCNLNNIPTVIITGEDTQIVQRRADKIKIDYLFLGVKNKVEVLQKLLTKLGLSWSEVAYLGDDINDYQVLKKAGYSACPKSAPLYIQKIVSKVIPLKGGDGVFRFFVEDVLEQEGVLKTTLDSYFESKDRQYNQ